MKFRLRSQSTRETQRIEISAASTLADLKSLIASKLSPSPPTESIRLSLNANDELVSDSPADPICSLGLANGDVLYFSILTQHHQTLTLAPNPPTSDETLVADKVQEEEITLTPAPNPPTSDETLVAEKVQEEEISMEIDVDVGRASSIPCFLKRVIEAEKGEDRSILGRLVIFVHASLLESGFVVSGGGSKLPADWASRAPRLSLQYTVPDIVADGNARNVTLRFSMIRGHATVYGCLVGSSDLYRVALNLSQLACVLSLDMNELSENEVKQVFELWKVVKDGLSLPLLIDLCHENGLVLPSCFMSLPIELKIKIVACLPGVDVARVGCTCTELSFLSSSDDIWKQKFVDEFGLLDERVYPGRNWKEKYAKCFSRRKIAEDISKRRRLTGIPYGIPMVYRQPLLRFPVIGGDHDILPDFSALSTAHPSIGFPTVSHPLPFRRNLSPNCDLESQP